MKKFVAMGALAVVLAACSLQQAKAWVNTKFAVGLNWAYQSGGNNLLWGVFRNGQPPACCDGPGCYGPGYGAPGYGAPGYGAPGYFHAQGFQGYPGYPNAGMAPTGPMPAPAAGPVLPQSQPSSYLGNSPYQTVNYPMYYQPNYFYPVSYGR